MEFPFRRNCGSARDAGPSACIEKRTTDAGSAFVDAAATGSVDPKPANSADHPLASRLEGLNEAEMEHKYDPNGAPQRNIARGFHSFLAMIPLVFLSTTAIVPESMGYKTAKVLSNTDFFSFHNSNKFPSH